MNLLPSDYRRTYDSIAPGYYFRAMQTGPSIQRFWHRQKFLSVARQIPSGSRVLDIGCGPGSFASILSELDSNFTYVGLDIAHSQLEFGAQNVITPARRPCFVQFDGGSLPIRDQSVDCVVMVELLEHLELHVQTQLLQECRRVLKKEGRLVVTTPNYGSHWPAIEWVLNRVSPVKYDEQHISKFSAASLHSTLAQNHFKVDKMDTIFFAAPFFSFLSQNLALKILAGEKKLPLLPGALLLASARPS